MSVTGQSDVHEVLVNRLGGLSLHRKSVVRLTDRPDMTLDVYRGRKTTGSENWLTSVYPVLLPVSMSAADMLTLKVPNKNCSRHFNFFTFIFGGK